MEVLDFKALQRDEYIDMPSDMTTKNTFAHWKKLPFVFWLSLHETQPNTVMKAVSTFCRVSTTYLCQQTHLAMATIKSKSRNTILYLDSCSFVN